MLTRFAGGVHPVLGFPVPIAVVYARSSSTPTDFKTFADDIGKMWDTQPRITKEQLNGIRVPVWIVDGDHDELIRRENSESMAAEIPGAGLLLQPEVSHFAMLQDPELFNRDAGRVSRSDRTAGESDLQDWIGGSRSVTLTEEVVGLGGYGRTLTVLTAQEAVDVEELEEDEELIESWKPRFRR